VLRLLVRPGVLCADDRVDPTETALAVFGTADCSGAGGMGIVARPLGRSVAPPFVLPPTSISISDTVVHGGCDGVFGAGAKSGDVAAAVDSIMIGGSLSQVATSWFGRGPVWASTSATVTCGGLGCSMVMGVWADGSVAVARSPMGTSSRHADAALDSHLAFASATDTSGGARSGVCTGAGVGAADATASLSICSAVCLSLPQVGGSSLESHFAFASASDTCGGAGAGGWTGVAAWAGAETDDA
jgi:hypothetical protein